MAGLAVCRSTGPVDRVRARNQAGGPVDRVSRPPESFCSLEKAPVDRSTGREFCSLYPAPVDRAVDQPESRCSLVPGPFDRRSTSGTTVIKITVGRSTGRSTGRSFLTFPGCQRAELFGAINTPHLS